MFTLFTLIFTISSTANKKGQCMGYITHTALFYKYFVLYTKVRFCCKQCKHFL